MPLLLLLILLVLLYMAGLLFPILWVLAGLLTVVLIFGAVASVGDIIENDRIKTADKRTAKEKRIEKLLDEC